LTNENYAFGLDALLMVMALGLFNVLHPGLVLRGPDSEFPRLSRKDRKALKRKKKEEKRARKKEDKARAKSGRRLGGAQQVAAVELWEV
jgi:hypothetical protein